MTRAQRKQLLLYLCFSVPRTGIWQFNMPACDFCSWKKMDPYKMYLCFFLTEYVFPLVMWFWVAENFSRLTRTTQGWWKSWNAGEAGYRQRCEHTSEHNLCPLLPLPTKNSSGARAVSQASGWYVRRCGSGMKGLSTGSSHTLWRKQFGVSAYNTKIRSSFERI